MPPSVHKLSDVDQTAKTGNCCVCGPVRVYSYRKYGKVYHRCGTLAKGEVAKWRKENPDKAAASSAKWCRNNPEKDAARRANFRAANPTYFTDWAANNRESRKAAESRRRVRAGLEMTREEKRLSVERRIAIKNDPCHYCGQRADVMHDDHFIPLARGGTDHASNLVRACASCNLRKGSMLPDEFLFTLQNKGVT